MDKRNGLRYAFLIAFGITVLAVLLVSGACGGAPGKGAPVSWDKKAPILINNTGTATTLTDFQVNLNVTYDSDMNADFSDLQVIDETPRLEIPYWIESKVDGSYANIWFKATNIPASVWINSTYYLYYNSTATSVSNVTNTFVGVIGNATEQPLLGSWTLDGNVLDTSGNNNDGTLSGLGYTTGKFGQVGLFDGNDYIKISSDSYENQRASVEAWIKTASPLGVISTFDNGIGYYGWVLFVDPNGYINYRINTFNGGILADVVSTSSVTDNNWHHVVATDDGTTLKIYIDGTLSNSAGSATKIWDTSMRIYLGAMRPESLCPYCPLYWFNGNIGGVRVYDRDLSGSEIADLYNNYGYVTTRYPGRILIRKYVSLEPIATLGLEQNCKKCQNRKK